MANFDTIIVPVSDLGRAKTFYTALLETEPFVDQPYYVAFQVGEVQVGLDPNGEVGGFGALPYWACGDIDKTIDAAVAAGGTVKSAPRDVGGGKQVAHVTDPDGNGIGLAQNPR